MLNFSYYAPTYYEFGRNSEEKVSNLIQMFGGTKVLIHYGSGSVIRSGLLLRIKKYLSNFGISYVELGGVKQNPESDLVYDGIDLCVKENVNFILAIGGGSVIDSAKAIASGVMYDGDFWDFFKDNNRVVVEKSLPVGVILTIAAAGSEGSPSMVITNSISKLKRGNIKCDVVRPKFAIMNPELTTTLSNYQTGCGIVDIMTHIFERYFSNTNNCFVSDNLCEGVLKSVIVNGKKLIENPNDYDARANIMWASTIAHNNICGVDREQDWASHKIEHELSAKYGIAHGAGLAVVVIKWMNYVSKKNPDKFLQLGKNVFNIDYNLFDNDVDYIKFTIKELQNFWISLGMPSRLEDIGYKKEDIDFLVDNIDYFSDGTIGNYVKLNKLDVFNIYNNS